MKLLKTLKKYKNKTLQLNLLKLKLYKNPTFSISSLIFNSKKIELNLKKTLHVIYEYHTKNKKILFLEFPKSFKNILKHTKHILIPNNDFYTDILNNKIINLTSVNAILQNKNISLNIIKILLQLNKKIDLIIICNLPDSDAYNTLIQKSYKSKTPVISCFNQLNTRIDYKIATYKSLNKKMLNNNFIITMIKTALKKAITDKKLSAVQEKKKNSMYFAMFGYHPNTSK